MGHCSAVCRLERQARLSAVERLDLAFLVDGDDDGVSGRIHVKADDVLDLLGEFGIVQRLKVSQAMGLQDDKPPTGAGRLEANVKRLGHRAAGPMGGLSRRLGTGRLQNFRAMVLAEQRSFARFARLVMQSPSTPCSPYCACQRHDRRTAEASRRATSSTGKRSAEPEMIFARCTSLCGRLRSPTIATALAIFGGRKDANDWQAMTTRTSRRPL